MKPEFNFSWHCWCFCHFREHSLIMRWVGVSKGGQQFLDPTWVDTIVLDLEVESKKYSHDMLSYIFTKICHYVILFPSYILFCFLLCPYLGIALFDKCVPASWNNKICKWICVCMTSRANQFGGQTCVDQWGGGGGQRFWTTLYEEGKKHSHDC